MDAVLFFSCSTYKIEKNEIETNQSKKTCKFTEMSIQDQEIDLKHHKINEFVKQKLISAEFSEMEVILEKYLNIPANENSELLSLIIKNNLAFVKFMLSKYNESHQILSKILISDEIDMFSQLKIVIYQNLATLHLKCSKYFDSMRIIESINNIKSDVLFINQKLIQCLILKIFGEFQASLDICLLLINSNEIDKKNDTTYQNLFASTLHIKGMVDFSKGSFESAIDLQKKALSIREKIFPVHHPMNLFIKHSIGNAYYIMGNFQQAIAIYMSVLDTRKSFLPENHSDIGVILNDIGQLQSEILECEKALGNFNKAASILELNFTENHADYATVCNNLAFLYEDTDKMKGIDLLLKALSIYNKLFPGKAPIIGIQHNNLGSAFYTIGNNEEAIAHFLKSKAIFENLNMHTNPDYLLALSNLGFVYEDISNTKEALSCYMYFIRNSDCKTKHSIQSTIRIMNRIGNLKISIIEKLKFKKRAIILCRNYSRDSNENLIDLQIAKHELSAGLKDIESKYYLYRIN